MNLVGPFNPFLRIAALDSAPRGPVDIPWGDLGRFDNTFQLESPAPLHDTALTSNDVCHATVADGYWGAGSGRAALYPRHTISSLPNACLPMRVVGSSTSKLPAGAGHYVGAGSTVYQLSESP